MSEGPKGGAVIFSPQAQLNIYRLPTSETSGTTISSPVKILWAMCYSSQLGFFSVRSYVHANNFQDITTSCRHEVNKAKERVRMHMHQVVIEFLCLCMFVCVCVCVCVLSLII